MAHHMIGSYLRGSALGVRVAGSIFGIFWGSLTILISFGALNWWICIPAYPLLLFLIIRPWFMGIWLEESAVIVRSWFRHYKFTRGSVEAVELEPYTGFAGFAVGWVPFCGSIRMLAIKKLNGKEVWLPSTVSRRNRALRNARQVRSRLGLPPR